MATCALNNILAQMKGKPLKAYTYKDHGSLVSLSNYSTVGSLMGNLMRGSMMVEGRIARFVYISLYRMHQIAPAWLLQDRPDDAGRAHQPHHSPAPEIALIAVATRRRALRAPPGSSAGTAEIPLESSESL
ncbi:FAD-dependent pyridine nucleotide-disulfide oxidoreductase [Klebsiella pneumoniae]|uniref:FAD-dependent pyridine nucleotide-disulfide oxidoreductase n=1 Tax=Klebsiella pneumoniae TaxID=573 RepID=A0A447S5N5_KLEPN|nr:FAD-dependent pyridine nucleotide-disulfide oxidoreductase [Klebsiella pneumoniae]